MLPAGRNAPWISVGSRGRIAAAVCWIVLLHAAALHAHVISIQRGAVIVHSDRVVVEWKIYAEDFVHYYGLGRLPSRPFSVEEIRRVAPGHAVLLLEHLIIRDASGSRLTGESILQKTEPADDSNLDDEGLRSMRINYVCEYRLTSPPKYLSFQQSTEDGPVVSPSQLYLTVRLNESDRPAVLRLTNGGNVETLEFDWPGADDGPPILTGPLTKLKSIVVDINIRSDEVRVTLNVPLPLLDTFLNIDRADRDFLTPMELDSASPAISELLNSRNPLRINQKPAAAGTRTLEFLEVDMPVADTAAPRRICAWLTRVRFVQTYKLETVVEDVELRWNLFNSAVFTAEATVTSVGGTLDHRISTYEPSLRWSRMRSDGGAVGE